MRLTVGKKLVGGFLAVALLVLISGIGTIFQLRSVQGVVLELSTNWLPATADVGRLDANMSNLQRLLNRHLYETEAANLEWAERDFGVKRQQISEALERYRKTITLEEERALFERIERQYASYLTLLEATATISRTGEKGRAVGFVKTKTLPVYHALKEDMERLLALNERGGKNAADRAEQVLLAALRNSLCSIVVVLLVGIALGLWLSRQLTRSIKQMADAAEAIARGELDQRLVVTSRDELGDMARSFERMTAYLKEVATTAEGMSRGDFTRNIAPKSERDQFGVAISQMITSLRAIVGRVRAASESVGAGAEQLSSSSSELSATVSLQAASSEETSATIVEMTASIRAVDQSAQVVGEKVKQLESQSHQLGAAVTQTGSSIAELAASIQQVAGNVAHASQVSDQAAQAANDGEAAVAQTIGGITTVAGTMTAIQSTIRHLEERSGEIGRIIEVIDDIADQTNLLALNAAIEAARAGEAGRGFAVVADEVRKLAERCAQATQEIGTLIKGVQAETHEAAEVTRQGTDQVQEGVRLATRTGDVLRQLQAAASEVNALMSQVASAADEQTRASSQIVASAEQMAEINRQVGDAVTEMNQATRTVTYATAEQRTGCSQVVTAVEQLSGSAQAAAAATEQVARTADDLKLQSTTLQEAMAFFKTGTAERVLEVGIMRSAARLPF